MPANVETMFSVKQTPWHGIGTVIVEAPNVEDGIKLAGLDWTADVISLTKPDGQNVDAFAKAFVRSDNGTVLGIVGPKTHPLQNKDAFAFFQPFIDSDAAFLETAGSLDEGRKIWVMAKIQKANSEIVKGDEIAKYILMSNSHDGTTAVRVGFTPIRVVCANTLAMAHKDKASKLIRVRHSKDVKTNVDEIQKIMNAADEQFEATAEQYRFLASKAISVADLKKFIKIVFKMVNEKGEISTRSENVIAEITKKHSQKAMLMDMMAMEEKERAIAMQKTEEFFECGRGTDNEASRGNYWTAYNAVNEYLNYERGHNQESRLDSLWFGMNATANELAFKTALDMANGVALVA